MTNLCFLDTETSGLSPLNHEVYEVGLIRRIDGCDTEYRWWLPIDLSRADPMALVIGGYYQRLPDDAPTEPGHQPIWWGPDGMDGPIGTGPMVDAMLDLAQLTAGCHLVGAVPSFDVAFLDPLLRAHGACPAWNYHIIDVEALVAGKLGFRPPWDSHALTAALGIDADDFDRHTALGDSRWARALFDAVLG